MNYSIQKIFSVDILFFSVAGVGFSKNICAIVVLINITPSLDMKFSLVGYESSVSFYGETLEEVVSNAMIKVSEKIVK